MIAHEIGHNLGLPHIGSNQDNLMSPGGETEQLTSSQTALVFRDDGGIDGYDFLAPGALESHYTRWASTFGLGGGPGTDHDGDRVANVIEFMLGMDPTQPDRMPEMLWGERGLTWRLPKSAEAIADGLEYRVEVSSDGEAWFPAGTGVVPHAVVKDDGGELIVRLDRGESHTFMRFATIIPRDLQAFSRTVLTREAADLIDAGRIPIYSACADGHCGCTTATPD